MRRLPSEEHGQGPGKYLGAVEEDEVALLIKTYGMKYK